MLTDLYAEKETLMDYLVSCFAGTLPLDGQRIDSSFPFGWLFSVSGCAFLNIDYMLYDLMEEGQQLLIRGGSRIRWFISKCIWNVGSTSVYFLWMLLTCFLFAFISHAEITMLNVSRVSEILTFGYISTGTPVEEIWLNAFLFPFITCLLLNISQMVLCLFIRPIFSFIIIMLYLVLGIYFSSPWFISSRAMAVRNSLYTLEGYLSMEGLLTLGIALLLVVVIGVLKMRFFDILGQGD